ncbi:MAG TPA: zinc-binding dehydrogenase, partial [Casimicrobiaceae bacterium]|nr:zinc-binding dehydrogenase [Casimicrobiaceae bacterium]
HLADYISSAEELGARARDLFAAYTAGTLEVAIDRKLPLGEAPQAHRRLEARETKGKLLLHI